MDDLESGTSGQWMDAAAPATCSTRALRITHDSMASRFPKGTIVITETEKQPVNGNLVVIRISGATELLAQFSAENDVAWVIPLDARHPVMRLNEGAVVCGVVTKVMVDVE